MPSTKSPANVEPTAKELAQLTLTQIIEMNRTMLAIMESAHDIRSALHHIVYPEVINGEIVEEEDEKVSLLKEILMAIENISMPQAVPIAEGGTPEPPSPPPIPDMVDLRTVDGVTALVPLSSLDERVQRVVKFAIQRRAFFQVYEAGDGKVKVVVEEDLLNEIRTQGIV